MKQARLLAHVDMDSFYASVEVLDDPSLAGKPVIVGGMGPRSVVSAASYPARTFGVRSAMPIFEARRLCPGGVFQPVRMERYKQVSRRVMDVLSDFTPLLEQVSVDEAYLDLTGTERLWGPPLAVGLALKRAVREATGLTCSVGLAPVRFLAKIAGARNKPDGLLWVEDVESFLQSLTLAEIPGVGARSQARLAEMGLTRLVDLRPLGEKRLTASLGALGTRLWELCRGRDEGGVEPTRPVKSVSHEITLDADTADPEQILPILLDQSHKVARRLRAKGLAGRTVVLKLKTTGRGLLTRSRTLPGPVDDGGEIFAAARELFQVHAGSAAYRLVGVGVGGLCPASLAAGDLFEPEGSRKRRAVAQAEDEVCRRFGSRALQRAGQLPGRNPRLDSGGDPGHNKK